MPGGEVTTFTVDPTKPIPKATFEKVAALAAKRYTTADLAENLPNDQLDGELRRMILDAYSRDFDIVDGQVVPNGPEYDEIKLSRKYFEVSRHNKHN